MSAPAATRTRGGPVDPRLWRRTAATRPFLLATVIIGVATAGLVIAQARLLSRAIGGVFEDRTVVAVWAVAPTLLLVFGGRALLGWLGPIVSGRAAAAVKSEFRRDILQARLRRPDSAVGAASLTAMITSGLDGLDGYFSRYLPQLVLALVVPLAIGTAVLATDWISAVIIALTLPLIPIFMILVGWLTQRVVRRRWRIQSRLAHHFADLIAGLPTLQVFGRARAQAEGLRRTGEAHRDETLAALRISFLSALVLELLASLSVALVAVGIGLRLVEGHLSLTTALFVLILAPEAYLPLRQVGSAYHDSADGVAVAERAFALIDDAPIADDQGVDDRGAVSEQPLPDLARATIEFHGVCVRGGAVGGPERLHRLDLLIRPGETVALAGPSGSGKSTALSVLLGFCRPTEGQLSVGGAPLTPADPQTRTAWLAKLAWVPQQPALLAGTIADNVRLGSPQAPTARVRAALDRAGGTRLELGQAVLAGSEGLSAGELRRVALARALLRIDCGGGELLVLDEPTAGLDAETELAAIAGVRSLGVGALVVSHRPAVLVLADRVVELAPVRA